MKSRLQDVARFRLCAMNTFEEMNLDHRVEDGKCWVDAEGLVRAIRSLCNDAANVAATQDEDDAVLTSAAIMAMATIGMALERGVTNSLSKNFAEELDKGIPEGLE